MQIDTPEGVLTIEDAALTFAPADDGPELTVSLDPMPEYKYERSVYGNGSLVIGGQVIVLRNEQASTVVEELRRPRANASKPRKSGADVAKTDSDQATSK